MIHKAALGAIGLASVSTAGVGVYYSGVLSSKKVNINSLLEKDDYIIVMKRDDKSWGSKWTLYGSSSNIFRIKNPSLDNLKKECSELFKNGRVVDSGDDLYLNFLKFCVRDKTTKEKLDSLGKSILSKDNQEVEWKKRFNEYKKDNSKNRFSGISVQSTDNESLFTKLSEGCNNLSDKAWREVKGMFSSLNEWCLSKS